MIDDLTIITRNFASHKLLHINRCYLAHVSEQTEKMGTKFHIPEWKHILTYVPHILQYT